MTLDGMTHERWTALTDVERDALRSDAGLTPQLVGLEGWRVEVETLYGETRRFYVGKSTGWEPIHLEVSRRDSTGGLGADRKYAKVTRLYRR